MSAAMGGLTKVRVADEGGRQMMRDRLVSDELHKRHRESSSSHRLPFDVAQLWKKQVRVDERWNNDMNEKSNLITYIDETKMNLNTKSESLLKESISINRAKVDFSLNIC